MLVKTRAYAAVTCLLLGFTIGAAPAAAQQASLVSDSLFILRAGSIGLLQAKLAKLAERKGASGSSFDKAYMEEVVKHHNEAVQLFREESESGRVVSLKQLASRMLPDVQQRLTLAAETGSSVGVDGTSTSAGGQGSGGN